MPQSLLNSKLITDEQWNEYQELKNEREQILLLLEKASKFIPLHYPETLLEIKNLLNNLEHKD